MGERDLIIMSELASVVDEINTVMETARSNVARQVNSELLNTILSGERKTAIAKGRYADAIDDTRIR